MSVRPAPSFQPAAHPISIKSILSLPFRICNPPPAVSKVRSCGVTPLYNVRLEDVLDRKHLPPLGLKDFEEWLLYVEMSPENLYFTLWLREYRQRYNQWFIQSKSHRETGDVNWSTCNSTQLAMFYARAKQTFLVPNSQYELNLPSNMLAPFHTSSESSHPDPAIFTDVAIETNRMLNESLRRFVQAQLNNVGNKRVLCGVIAGLFLCLLGFIPPITLNFTSMHSRWTRLAALPGLWIGLSIMFAALNGICVGVYIFGDLRQLRKFELARPPISRPQPISEKGAQQDLKAGDSRTRCSSLSSSSSFSTGPCYVPPADQIHISQAYYDDDPVDGPATSPGADINYISPVKKPALDAQMTSPYMTTAGFIHPFDPVIYDDEMRSTMPEEKQTLAPFDFDALPPRKHSLKPTLPPSLDGFNDMEAQRPPEPSFLPARMIARFQSRCNIENWRLQTGYLEKEPYSPTTTVFPSSPSLTHHSRPSSIGTETKVRKRFRTMLSVPAFAVPLTRVLSPVIVRGQWEIIVRSSMLAFLVSWVIVGSLLALPVTG